MPKSEGTYLYYAVQNGREGPRVYTSLSDVRTLSSDQSSKRVRCTDMFVL